MLVSGLPDAKYHPETLTEIKTKYKGNFKAFAKKYYSKSPFASENVPFVGFVDMEMVVNSCMLLSTLVVP